MATRVRSPNGTLHMGEASRRAVAKLAEQQILVGEWASQPGKSPPTVPPDITEVRDSRLMDLFGTMEHWMGYLTLQSAAAQVDESFCDDAITRLEGKRGYDFRKGGMKERAADDPEYQQLRQDKSDAYGYRKMTEALLTMVTGRHAHLSRELSRRANRK